MYEMTFREIGVIIDCYSEQLKERNNEYIDRWEQTRKICYFIAQVNSSKQLSIKKLIPFPWDKIMSEDEKRIELDKRNALIEKVKLMTNIINKNGRQ